MIKFILVLFCCCSWTAQAQQDPFAPLTEEEAAADYAKKNLPSFEEYLNSPKNIEVSRIEVEQLVGTIESHKAKVHLIDARTLAEFDISHIQDAVYAGYHDFTPNRIWTIGRDARVIVYSTTSGKRGLNLAQYLMMMGYTDVQVLEEGLIGLKNYRQVVFNSKNKKTDKIHIGHKNNIRLVRLGLVVY